MNVLISGGTGTFGNAFIRAALKRDAVSRLAVFSRDEAKQHYMGLRPEFQDARLRWFIGDVRDYDRLLFAMRGVDVVVHAAALKHVISGELNPFEHIKTNVLGSQNVVMAAVNAGVPRVMALSSDKAVEPINLYGSTKMCMERLFIAANSLGKTKFSLARYGNVLGSRGSFIELLEKLRDSGAKSFPLRSLESTRFWITADAAAEFVLSRVRDMQGGEIFVPKLPSSTALEFARRYLPEAQPEIVGIPVGEKVHETLVSEAESQYVVERDGFYEIRPRGPRDEKIKPWTYTSKATARPDEDDLEC